MVMQKINYNTLFEHAIDLPLVLHLSSPRSGTDFFHSLFDGHPEILHQPGAYDYCDFWLSALCKENLDDLIYEFIYRHTHSFQNQISKFKSVYNKYERWNQLGENKDESFCVSIDDFIQHMHGLLDGRELTAHSFFYAYHVAYALCSGMEVKATKLLYYHIHNYKRFDRFAGFFPDFSIVFSYRDPRNIISTEMEHKINRTDKEEQLASAYLFKLGRALRGIEDFRECDLKVVVLEDLHLYPDRVLGAFARHYGISHEDSMYVSSYHGKQWWGDSQSKKYLKNFSHQPPEEKWLSTMTSLDDRLVQALLYPRLKRLGFQVQRNLPVLLLSPILILVPTKYELRILFTDAFRPYRLRKKLGRLLSCLRCYIARVQMFYGLFVLRLTGKVYTPEKFYDESV